PTRMAAPVEPANVRMGGSGGVEVGLEPREQRDRESAAEDGTQQPTELGKGAGAYADEDRGRDEEEDQDVEQVHSAEVSPRSAEDPARASGQAIASVIGAASPFVAVIVQVPGSSSPRSTIVALTIAISMHIAFGSDDPSKTVRAIVMPDRWILT